jgi:hypothetical protein
MNSLGTALRRWQMQLDELEMEPGRCRGDDVSHSRRGSRAPSPRAPSPPIAYDESRGAHAQLAAALTSEKDQREQLQHLLMQVGPWVPRRLCESRPRTGDVRRQCSSGSSSKAAWRASSEWSGQKLPS